ncbi:uncharacterized protein LOC127381835 [Apus apus]|uniref:uncharacterized protein LOC127381835 n=1 Tax=Apus apus TaxID=8895 RepID=UPI0021F8493B|nr:uncharacterized protein LOC127381835 [Apus apus]
MGGAAAGHVLLLNMAAPGHSPASRGHACRPRFRPTRPHFREGRGSGRKRAGRGRGWLGGTHVPRSDVTRPTSGAGSGAPMAGGGAAVGQEPVTFEDVAVPLSRAEWEALGPGQRELYRRVTRDTYQLLTSLGYPGPKPDILYRLERGEEPWVSGAQSPGRWDQPHSPSAGHKRDGGCLEEPPSGWWPDPGGRRVTEERAETPSQGESWCLPVPRPPLRGERCFPWRLRCQRLLRKCLEDGGEVPAEGASRGAGLAGSQDQVQVQVIPWLGNEVEVKEEEGVTASLARITGFPLHPAPAEQDGAAGPGVHQHPDPEERPPRSPLQCPPPQGEYWILVEMASLQENGDVRAEELEKRKELVWTDHCYCAGSRRWLLQGSLREHNYCQGHKAGLWELRDHGYCHRRGTRQRGAGGTARPPGLSHRLAQKRFKMKRIIQKAKWVKWNSQPPVRKTPQFSWGSSKPVAPRPGAGGRPASGTRGALCLPAGQDPAPPQPCSEGSPQEVTSGAMCTPLVTLELPAAPSAPPGAVEGVGEATPGDPEEPEAEPGPSGAGKEPAYPSYLFLCDVYEMVMWTLDHGVDTPGQSSQLAG